MPRVLARKVAAAFALGLLMVGGISAVMWSSIQRLLSAQDRVAETQALLLAYSAVAQNLALTESATRGYVATGDPRLEQAYQVARRRSRMALAETSHLVRRDTARQRRLADLRGTVTDGLEFLSQVMVARRAGRHLGAEQLLRSAGGRTVVDSAIVQAHTAIDTEKAILQARMTTARESGAWALRLNAIGLLVGLLLGCIATWVVARGEQAILTAHRERATQLERIAAQTFVLERQNDLLQAQSEELQKQSEELAQQASELLQAQDYLSAIISSTEDAVLVYDTALRYTLWNPAAERLLGIPRDAAVGRTMREVFPDLVGTEREEYYHATLAGQPTPAQAVRRHHHAGQEVWFDVSHSPLRTRDGRIEGGVVLAREATERILAREALAAAKAQAERASEAKSAFVARMSHELRTPLNAVIGFSEILRTTPTLTETPRGHLLLDRIHANGRHLLALVDDVLDLSKIEAGRMTAVLEPTDLAAVLPTALVRFEPQLRERDVTLRLEIPPDLRPIATDPAKFTQIVTNLVSNALKFTARGHVTVRILADPTTHAPQVLEVSDTGIGIPTDRQAAIFAPFEQAESDTSRRYGGTGLGLAIVRSFCDLLGYEIAVDSTPGTGTTFRIGLGVSQAQAV